MIDKILEFALRQRVFILIGAFALIVVGAWSAAHLPIDAVPDITNVQVQINTAVPAFAPEEIEQLITYPIEVEMGGIQDLLEIRSISKFGLSQVTLIFEEGSDLYRSRQLVSERLQAVAAEMPPDVTPQMAPISTGLGEIYHYTVGYKADAKDIPTDPKDQLRQLKLAQDYIVKPLLRTVPGITEVNTSGGYTREIVVMPDPDKLRSVGVTISELADTIGENTQNAGGSIVEKGGESVSVRSLGRVQSAEEVANLPLKFAGTPTTLRVKDVAEVAIGSGVRTGAATLNGKEAVIGSALMLIGENSRLVSERVHEKIDDIQRKLPPGMEIVTLYNRTDLVDATIATVEKNLFEGAILVIVVLIGLLGNWRAALIVASAIPLSMLFALTNMVQLGVSGNLMSLGAVDFGLIVDGAVVMAENIVRRLAHRQHELGRLLNREERLHTILSACKQVGTPTVFGVTIITIVYVPLLTLTGVEGKMFKPMALTVMFALVGALILSLTVIPVLCSYFMTKKVSEEDNFFIRWCKAIYAPALNFAIHARWVILAISVGIFALSMAVFSRLGAEFIPQLDEGSGAIQMIRTTSIGLTPSVEMQNAAERLLVEEFPEITNIFARVGTSEVATDPMGVNVGDSYVMLKKPSEFRKENGKPISKEQLMEMMSERLKAKFPGQSGLISQPIELRFNELLSGSRADIAIKIFGDDFDELEKIGNEVREIVEKIPGASDVEYDAVGKAPILQVEVDREAMTQYNVQAQEVNDVIETAFAGKEVGVVVDGNRRYPIVIRLREKDRADFAAVENLPLRSENGGFIPLGKAANATMAESVNTISRESFQRRLTLMVNLRGTDVQTFVDEARRQIDEKVTFPDGYFVDFGGTFENLQQARARLAIVVPAALAMIFLLIFMAFRSVRQALIIYTGIPLAVTGGIFALWLRDMPFSISAGVGFIALSGIAVLNGVVMLSFFNQLREEGESVDDAVRKGAMDRLRPVLMTAMVASFGFIPMALGHGAGAEVQRPLATVVIGGIITATFLTLLLLPSLYHWVESGLERKRARREKSAAVAATAAILFAFGLFAAPSSQAAEAPTGTIDALVAEAMASNPELSYYEAELAALKSGKKRAATPAEIPQPLDFPSRETLRRSILDRDADLAKLALAEFRFVLAATVRLHAVEYLAAQATGRAAADLAASADALVAMLKKRPTSGFDALLEIRILSGSNYPIRQAAAEARAEQDQLTIALNGLLGRPANAALTLEGSPPGPALNPDGSSPDLIAASLALATREARIARGVFGVDAASEAEMYPVSGWFTTEGLGAVEDLAGLSRPVATSATAGPASIQRMLAEDARAKLTREFERRNVALAATRQLLATMSPEAIDEIHAASELADRQYRIGGISISLFVEMQRAYLEAVETRNHVLVQAWRNQLDFELLTYPASGASEGIITVDPKNQ